MLSTEHIKRVSARTIWIHLLGGIAFLILPLISSPHTSFHNMFHFGPPEMQDFMSSFLLVLFFYANYYYFVPELLIKRKYGDWMFFLIISIIIIFVLPYFLFNNAHFEHFPAKDFNPDLHRHFDRPHDKPEEHLFRGIFFEETIIKFLFVLALSILLKTNKLWKESREEKKKAELAFLKSQVNPHFLFNTLNGIYSLSLTNDKNTPNAIIKLSELMRYVVSEIEKDYVLLGQEIEYLKNYIELQQLRLGETANIRFDVSDADKKMKISPLLLIFFVENAFKYGVSTKKVSEINILIKTDNNLLYFSVKNQKNNHTAEGTLKKGLENVIRRLELIYPQQHTLKINETDIEYHVELTIKTQYD